MRLLCATYRVEAFARSGENRRSIWQGQFIKMIFGVFPNKY